MKRVWEAKHFAADPLPLLKMYVLYICENVEFLDDPLHTTKYAGAMENFIQLRI